MASERRARSLLARSLKNPESAARARSLAEKSSSVPLALARSRKFSEFLEHWNAHSACSTPVLARV